jgi:uncharacterized protein YhjY with autotransporter beta-barrel domain
MPTPAKSFIVARKHAVRGGTAAVAVSQVVALSMLGQQAEAGVSVPSSILTTPGLYEQYSPIERDFALAVGRLDEYNSTTFLCGECASQPLLQIVNTLDTLTFSANQVLQGGEGGEGGFEVFSTDAFNNALRWLAPEELFALAPLANGFGNSQVDTLDNHIDATRSVSRARLFASNVVSPTLKRGYAANAGAGAGGDFSRFNLFFDVSAGFGDRDDTTDTGYEDAFDFDSRELALGVDWRFSDNLVTGAMLGYTDRNVDFSFTKSRSGGKVEADGFSLMAFAQYDTLHWYGSASVGFQKLGYDFTRRIAVSEESESPDNFYAPNARATGSPDGSGLLASVNAGLPFTWGAWGTDIFVKGVYQKQSIDAFSEEVSPNSDPGYSNGFGFNVSKQDIKSFDTALGVKINYVATPSFGVVVPYLRGEFHQQLEDSPHRVGLEFQGLEDVDTTGFTAEDIAALNDAFQFDLRSDTPDKSWISVAAGVSAVLRGSNRVSDSGRGSGGLQAYLQYSTVFGLAQYNRSAVTAGVRYEF